MPGRPKTMAKKVTELEERAFKLAADVFLAAPQRYLDDPAPKNEAGCLWKLSAEFAKATLLALEELAMFLREKANITDPGPTERFRSECENEA